MEYFVVIVYFIEFGKDKTFRDVFFNYGGYFVYYLK